MPHLGLLDRHCRATNAAHVCSFLVGHLPSGVDSWLAFTPCARATRATEAPG